MSESAAEATTAAAAPAGPVKIARALISVSDKTGAVEFAKGLTELGIEIVSTGGTATALRQSGLEVRGVEELTGSPEILGGRVKTLHPRLHAALLALRDDPEHQATLEEQEIESIDLVCVNLYPFERTAARRGVGDTEVIENIDIGGPTMIRAAAKNHRHITVVVRPESYDAVLAELVASGGEISEPTRRWLANEAFAYTAAYEASISRWFGEREEEFPGRYTRSYEKVLDLSYGENPHQRAAYYTETGARSHVLSRVAKLHGKSLSFNNVLDLDSARKLLAEFSVPACVIVKHNNPCGVAIGDSVEHAYEKALACDPTSAFGGVIAFNRKIGQALAERLNQNFVEVLIAPSYEQAALVVLQGKEAIRILEDDERRKPNIGERDLKRVRGGLLVQDLDTEHEERELMQVVTEVRPTEAQWGDLLFAWRVAKHVRSNAIVLAKEFGTVGIGAGQMSRVDSVKIAIDKAREAHGAAAGEALRGSVAASDAFFPFPDGPQAAIEAGATAIIQPGGSKRDEEVIATCDAAKVPMVFTKRRHFRH